jgi:hypothetical protein
VSSLNSDRVTQKAWNGSPESSAAALVARLGPRLGVAASFATTEHFNLQPARAITVSEANGRASIYVAVLSSSLVALAFVGQSFRPGATFYAFAGVLLSMLAFVGVVTFLRLVQSSIEDMAYAHRIGLLRGFYVQLVPELRPYLVVRNVASVSRTDTAKAVATAWQLTFTTAGMVGVVNSVVIAVSGSLVLHVLDLHSLPFSLSCAIGIGVGAFWLHEVYHRRARDAFDPSAVDVAAISVPQDSLPLT